MNISLVHFKHVHQEKFVNVSHVHFKHVHCISNMFIVRRIEMFLEISANVKPLGTEEAGHLVGKAVGQAHMILEGRDCGVS